MSVNKNESQQQILTYNELTTSSRFVLITPTEDATIPFGDKNSGMVKAISDALTELNTTSISYDTSGSISVGDASEYRFVKVIYTAERGSNYRGGEIMVLNNGVNFYANDKALDTTDEEDRGSMWIKVRSVSTGGDQILITFDTDDIDTDTTYITYKILEQIPIYG